MKPIYNITQEKIVLICVICTVLLATVVLTSETKQPDSSEEADGAQEFVRYRRMWRPRNGTRADFLRRRGMSGEEHERVKVKLAKLKALVAKKFKISQSDSQPIVSDDVKIGDIVLTEQQLDHVIRLHITRTKRKQINFDNFPFSKWTFPILYMFDGSQGNNDETAINQAIQFYHDNTCLRFKQVYSEDEVPVSSTYLLFTNDNSGCWSFIGKLLNSTLDKVPQPVNLQHEGCTSRQGIIQHEIGHAVGFYHEQSRPDRNEFVDIFPLNVLPDQLNNFIMYSTEFIDSMATPYDYSSVMHYDSRAFSKNSSQYYTIYPKDNIYLGSMGQRAKFSFLDLKLLNRGYCSDSCSTTISCSQNGFQDPNDCTKCQCPDGFGSRYCDAIQPSDPKCGMLTGTLTATNRTQYISSPGYDSYQSYPLFISCNWIITAPAGQQIRFSFPSRMYLLRYVNSDMCEHWLEIKYKKDLSYLGQRFCEYGNVPHIGNNGYLITESNQAIVTFRSDVNVTTPSLYGFKLAFSTATDQPVIGTGSRPSLSIALFLWFSTLMLGNSF